MNIVGDTTPQINREEIRFSPLGGGEYSRRIEGPVDAVRAMVQEVLSAGGSGVFVWDRGPNATLDYTLGSIDLAGGNAADETPQQIWELSAGVIEKDILRADLTIITGLSSANKELLRKAIDGTALTPTEQATLSVNAALIYSDVKEGIRAIRFNFPTLSVTKIVSNSYQVKASLTNVGRLISTSTLSFQESIPSSILFNLPDLTPASGTVNKAYGWYKSYPTVTVSGRNKFSVRQEWEYDIWTTTLYGAVL